MVDAGPPVIEPVKEPEPIDVVAAFPEPPAPDPATDDGLLQLLLTDPAHAEAALVDGQSPDAFRIAILAGFAISRGEKGFDVRPEPLLPLLEGDAGVADQPLDAGTTAWVVEDGAALTSGGKTLRTLPLGTEVQVLKTTAKSVSVSLESARVVLFGATGRTPEKRVTETVRGELKPSALRSTPLDVDKIVAEAQAQPRDEDEGKLRAIALWQRAWRIERSPRTREGLMRAGYAARRASTVVMASLARDFAPVKNLTLDWACGTDAPPSTQRLEFAKGAPPAKLGPKQCVRAWDARQACDTDSASEKKKRAARKTFLDSVASPHAWLHFTVDARTPRQLFVVTSPLEFHDACADFQEVSLEAGNGRVRRLAFPLGTATQDVWVPVERTLGVEHAIVSAASEQHAIEWMRARERYRWTIGAGQELQVSLTMNAMTFKLPGDVTAATKVVPPERSCDCASQSPE